MSIAKGLKKEDKNFGARPKNKNPTLGFIDWKNQKEKESGNIDKRNDVNWWAWSIGQVSLGRETVTTG